MRSEAARRCHAQTEFALSPVMLHKFAEGKRLRETVRCRGSTPRESRWREISEVVGPCSGCRMSGRSWFEIRYRRFIRRIGDLTQVQKALGAMNNNRGCQRIAEQAHARESRENGVAALPQAQC